MSSRLTHTMYVLRYFTDDYGEEQELEIELGISGSMCSAEPDVGIMSSWAEDICAEVDGLSFELTDDEETQAVEILAEAWDNWEPED